MSYTDRIIVLVDMDCFYCQVEEKLNPNLKGKPVAVVQYNAWRGGGIIAVNYQAREFGVTRHIRGDEAKRKCPSIELVRVPNVRGKADLSKYRDAGKLVAKVLQTFTPLIERASVDEAYLDITEAVQMRLESNSKEITLSQLKNTHVVNSDLMDFLYNLYNSGLYEESNMKLAVGGVIVEEIRAAVFEQTGYTCSAGIAHNKILAKVACGLHKPNKQTVLPQSNVQEFYKNLPVRKIRSLGGKFGNTLSEDLGITYMAELLKFSEKELAKRYDEKTASFLYNIARGIDINPVTVRLVCKSIGCCKKFAGKAALIEIDSVKHWLNELADEVIERLEDDFEENNRRAKQIVISYSQEVNRKDVASSRTFCLNSYDSKKLTADAYEILKKNCLKPSGTFCLKFLGFNAGKFENCRNVNEITSFFDYSNKSVRKSNEAQINEQNQEKISNLCQGEETNFSDSTVELDENSSELAFFTENTKGNNSDSDSISNELCQKSSNNLSENLPQKQSFFLKYFENLKKECKTPVERDFNTSRNLELDEGESSETENIPEESLEEIFNSLATSNILHDIPGTSRNLLQIDEEIYEICSECNKKVLKTEIISHMDYHFAIKMVREESNLYKKEPPLPNSPKEAKKMVKKSLKRKSAEVEKNSRLTSFFKVNLEQAECSTTNTEVCPQCSKNIDVGDFVSHMDYHAAKKLHLEINPVKSCAVECLNKNSNKKVKKAKSSKDGITSVANFFKPIN